MRVRSLFLYTLLCSAIFVLPATDTAAMLHRKILIIDTVMSARDSLTITVSGLDRKSGMIDARWFRGAVRKNRHPDFVVLVEPDEMICKTELQLPLDDSGGLLTIKNAFLIKEDTIRISRLPLLHNCFPDSTIYSISWFETDPSGQKELKQLSYEQKVLRSTKRPCKDRYPVLLPLSINGRSYEVPVVPVNHMDIRNWWHGYEQMSEQQLLKMLSSDQPYKYSGSQLAETNWLLDASIILHERD